MTQTGGLSTGLAFLPNWLSDSDTASLETSLQAWVRASGWTTVGLVWPLDGPAKAALLTNTERVEALATAPAELSEVAKSLLGGSQTVVWQVPNSSGRLYTLLSPPGLPVGAIWAERSARDQWSEADRSYFVLSAKILERSAHLGKKIGPIIEPNRLEQRLKDASVIAGRMAHDFDNILTGIMGFADLTQPMLAAGSQPAKFVSEINKVGSRGIVFTQQLHQLSRSAQVKAQPGSIAAAVAKEEARLRPAMPTGVNIVSNIPQNLANVAMDAGALGTVLGHLLENAVEASPANGRIVVTTKLVELNWSEARRYLGQVHSDTYVEITIQDFGTGIKSEVRSRLFAEPFFTTKVRHRGLGLAIVYRVLFAHRGGIRIDAASPPESGTVVRVVIPLASARPAVAPTAILGTSA
jgi:signal transduction histidine kinase